MPPSEAPSCICTNLFPILTNSFGRRRRLFSQTCNSRENAGQATTGWHQAVGERRSPRSPLWTRLQGLKSPDRKLIFLMGGRITGGPAESLQPPSSLRILAREVEGTAWGHRLFLDLEGGGRTVHGPSTLPLKSRFSHCKVQCFDPS